MTAHTDSHIAAPPVTTADGFDYKAFRNALAAWATGVSVVTSRAEGVNGGEPVGLTVNSFASVSLEPPLVLWSLAKDSPSVAVFRAASHYTINVLGEAQTEISNRFAARGADKFAGLACCPGLDGVPMLPGCIAWYECRIEQLIDGGDHLILLGRVESFAAVQGGKPLLFFGGNYQTLS